MTIVWFSRHEPTSRQLTQLKSTFGPALTIVQDREAFDGAAVVAKRFRDSGADELVIVAPLSVVKALVKQGIHPLWAQMQECPPSHPQCEVTISPRHGKPRHYRFIKFWRIDDVQLKLSEIGQPAEGVTTNGTET